jgi:thiosulfate dehydrogenase [quinone] large subunit
MPPRYDWSQKKQITHAEEKGSPMLDRTTRWLLASIQAIIGWEWLMSGSNKLLSGTFPQGLASTISDMMKNNPDSWYVAFLQHVILPQSVSYGYLIEWTEVTIGVIFVGGACILLGQPRRKGQAQYHLTIAYSVAAMIAALLGAFMTINFHFLAGGWILPWFDGSAANGEGIDLDALLPPFELIIFLAQGAFLAQLTGVRWSTRLQHLTQHPRRHPNAATLLHPLLKESIPTEHATSQEQ